MRNTLRIFKALSDPTRLRIVMLLLQRDLCVCELLFILKMEQSRISHQLRILRDADLVEDIRQGKWIIYRIPKSVKSQLKSILKNALDRNSESWKVVDKDRKNMEICRKKQIRKRGISLELAEKIDER
jgi:ArsR family transcriptional regulator